MELDIRAFNLISEKALDDRAVEELAYAVAHAGTLGGEALGATTRRESELTFGDLLEPVDLAAVRSEPGARFLVTLASDPDVVLGVFFASETFAVALADLFFGGPGEGAERRLTDIEAQAISSLAGGAIAPVVGVLSGREGCHVALHPVKEAELDTPAIVKLSMQMTVGGSVIEAALFAPDPDGSSVDGTSRDAMTAKVRTMPVEIDIDLARVEMAAAEVQALAEGDVIVFDVSQDTEVTARTGSEELLRGRVSETGGRRLLEVTQVLATSA